MRSSFFLNNLQIYLNGKLIDTITTTPTNWGFYSNFVYPTLETNTILSKGQTIQIIMILLYVIFNFVMYLHPEFPTLQQIIHLKLVIFTER